MKSLSDEDYQWAYDMLNEVALLMEQTDKNLTEADAKIQAVAAFLNNGYR